MEDKNDANVVLAGLSTFQRMAVTYRSHGRNNYTRMRCRTRAHKSLGCEVQMEMMLTCNGEDPLASAHRRTA